MIDKQTSVIEKKFDKKLAQKKQLFLLTIVTVWLSCLSCRQPYKKTIDTTVDELMEYTSSPEKAHGTQKEFTI